MSSENRPFVEVCGVSDQADDMLGRTMVSSYVRMPRACSELVIRAYQHNCLATSIDCALLWSRAQVVEESARGIRVLLAGSTGTPDATGRPPSSLCLRPVCCDRPP